MLYGTIWFVNELSFLERLKGATKMTNPKDQVALPFDPNTLDMRPILSSDLGRVMQVERAAYPIPWTLGVFEDCLSSNNECSLFFSGEHILGYAIVSHVLDETHLLNICIDPRYAGRGFGRHYLSAILRSAKDRGSVMFFLEVRASNVGAIHLYHSLGFNETGIRKNYYPAKNGREDAVLMTFDLSTLSDSVIDTFA